MTAYENRTDAGKKLAKLLAADFHAVGEFYKDFEQVDDETVKKLLTK